MDATRYPETARTIDLAYPEDRAELRRIAREFIFNGYTDHFIADRLCDILDDAEGASP